MGFEPAPFCAAPMPNQKRRLPIAWLPSPIPRGYGLPMASISSGQGATSDWLQWLQRMTMSEGTVKFHINHLLQKLGAADRTQAVLTALKRGFAYLDEGTT